MCSWDLKVRLTGAEFEMSGAINRLLSPFVYLMPTKTTGGDDENGNGELITVAVYIGRVCRKEERASPRLSTILNTWSAHKKEKNMLLLQTDMWIRNKKCKINIQFPLPPSLPHAPPVYPSVHHFYASNPMLHA